MSTRGIDALYLTTHNWGATAKFLTGLGYRLEFDTGHESGQLRSDTGPYLFVAEIPPHETPELRPVLVTDDEHRFAAEAGTALLSPFADTHYGTREATVADPDGRVWVVQAPSTVAR